MDESEICMENMDNLTEDQLRLLEIKWKNENCPPYRLYALIPFNLGAAYFAKHYTLNFKYYSKKFFKPQNFSFREIMKYGTIQSVAFMILYVGGNFAVSGLWHPVLYLRGLAQIKGKQIDTAVKFDPYAQQYFLYDFMSYFGLSEELIKKAKDKYREELVDQRTVLDNKNFFSEDTKKLLNTPVDLIEQMKNEDKQ